MSRALSITELADLLARGSGEGGTAAADSFQTILRSANADVVAPSPNQLVPAEPALPAPRHFAPNPDIARALGVAAQLGDDDPIRQAWKSGFEDGIATEKRLAREDTEALTQLREQVRQINTAAMQMLESRMREAVVTLCRQVIDDCQVPPERLATRIQTAVKMLTAAHNEKTIEVSPEDFMLLGGLLPAEWELTANPELPRGAIRVTTPGGGIEDGPEQWKLALEEAIRTC